MLNHKRVKITYLASTMALSFLTIYAIVTYIFNYNYYYNAFTAFSYPTYLIYPLAVLKTLGLIALWSKRSQFLSSLAYAGFFYNAALGFVAHISIGDNQQWAALLALILVSLSYFSSTKLKVLGGAH